MFSKKCFCKENISKSVRPLLAALSVNGLTMLLPAVFHQNCQAAFGFCEYENQSVPVTLDSLTNTQIWIPAGTYEKVAIDERGKAVVYLYSNFLHLTYNWLVTTSPQYNRKVRIIKIPNFKSECSPLNPFQCWGYYRPNHNDAKIFEKPLKSCHVGTHWIALWDYSQMITHVPGF